MIPSTSVLATGMTCSMMMKTTQTLSWTPISILHGGEPKSTSENIAMDTETAFKVPLTLSMMSGLESGLLQQTFVLFGSEVSTITTLHMPTSVIGLIAHTPTSKTKILPSTLTALLICLDHLDKTLSQLSKKVNALKIPLTTQKRIS